MIRFNAPDFKLGGTITGERTIEGVGSIVFEDLANQLRGVVTLGTHILAAVGSPRRVRRRKVASAYTE